MCIKSIARRWARLVLRIGTLVVIGLSPSVQNAAAAPAPEHATNAAPVVTNPLEKLLHPDRTNVDSRLITANNTFGFDLLRQLAAGEPDRNILVSPLSISVALTMTLNGAANKTRQEMTRALQLEPIALSEVNQAHADLQKSLGSPNTGVALVMANSLWTRQGGEFRSDFLDANRKFFGAKVAALDFADPKARDTINDWVGDATQGKIKTIVDQLDSTADMVLTNAIYFKGRWQVEFDKTKTQPGAFHRPGGEPRQVPMMTQAGQLVGYQGNRGTVVNLPYSGSRISLVILLPDEDLALSDFVKMLTLDNWQKWTGHLEVKRGYIVLPRFKIEDEHKLNEPLQALGMTSAFGPTADFSNISVAGLRLSEVRHKAFVEVNEEGTEAAASTAVITTRSLAGFRLVADRPFVAAILDNETGSLLFLSLVTDPQ